MTATCVTVFVPSGARGFSLDGFLNNTLVPPLGCGAIRPPNPLDRPNVGCDFLGVLIAAPHTPWLVFFIVGKYRAKRSVLRRLEGLQARLALRR